MPFKEYTSKYFFGRTHEIDVLRRAAPEAGSGDANSIILYGKRGIGKTELLRHLFIRLFNDQSDAVPFFYTVKTAFTSVNSFSTDYLSNFILQSLAFIRKDSSLINSGLYSLEDLRDIAGNSGAQWAVDIIDNYLKIKEKGDPVKMYSYAVSVPYHSYLGTGMPVLAIIDDFHKMHHLCKAHAESGSNDLWTLFENSINFRFTPHILAGFQAELHRMFFEETTLGEHLEIFNLPGLNRDDSAKLFTSVCEKYALSFGSELMNYLDPFSGNPFYIKSFVQAARQEVKSLTEEAFWEIYTKEITRGKIYTYWTSILKTYIPRFELRKPSLNILFYLSSNNMEDVYADLSGRLNIQREELDHILNLLQTSGTVEMGFSTIERSDDEILNDVIRGLYHREIKKEPVDRIKDLVTGDKRRHVQITGTPSFDITIPSTPRAELVAVKSLEQIARHYKIPLEITGQLQIALVELFTGILEKNGPSAESYQIKFNFDENIFTMEVLTPERDIALSDDDSRRLRSYLDNVRVEGMVNGSRIILIKEIK